MSVSRRTLLAGAAFAAGALALESPMSAAEKEPPPALPRFGVSTYSFWQFRHEPLRDVEKCIERASEWGFQRRGNPAPADD